MVTLGEDKPRSTLIVSAIRRWGPSRNTTRWGLGEPADNWGYLVIHLPFPPAQFTLIPYTQTPGATS